MKFEISELLSCCYDDVLVPRWTCQEKSRIRHKIVLTLYFWSFMLQFKALSSAHIEMSPGQFLLFFDIKYRVMSRFIIIFHLRILKFYQISTYPTKTQNTHICFIRTPAIKSNIGWFMLTLYKNEHLFWQSKMKWLKWYA